MVDSDSETDLPLSSRKKVARKKKIEEKKVPVKRIRKKKIRKTPAEKKVECPDCGMKFYWLSKLKDHQRNHTGEKPYECDVCHKRFSQSYSLKGHKFIHTDEKPYKCNFCPYACRDTSTLRKHHYRHMGIVQKYNCNMCSEIFTLKYMLKRHIAEVHLQVNLRTHKCDQCGKMYKSAMDVTKHIKHVHERAYETTCPVCNKYLTTISNLKTHMLSHISEKPYMCDVKGCDKRYKDKSSLVKHSRLHEPNKQYKCTECDHTTTRMHRLKYHMLKVHQRSKHVECDYCGQKFYSKRYLILHIARKHDERRKRYTCDSCGFVAKNKTGMVTHIKFGHNDSWNDLQCNLCRRTYKKHEYLKIHYKRTHNIPYKSFREKNIALGIKLNNVRIKTEPKDSDDETQAVDQVIEGRCIKNGDKEIKKTSKKPYKNPVNLNLFKCDLCGRFFKKKPRLANHMLKVHQRIKSVPCDQCGLKFYSKNYLISHMYKQHMRDKEYICDLCGYKTTYKPSIAIHVRYGHVDKIQCLMCKKKFKWLENLKLHYSEIHKTSYSEAVAREKQQSENLQIKKEQLNTQDEQQIDLFEIEKHELPDIPLTSDGSASLKGLIERGGVRSVPEKIFEDFCSGHFVYVPEGVSRDAATGRRRKQDIGFTDKTLKEKANSTIEKLLSVARKKRAFDQLETARKHYNQRMKNIFKQRKENNKIQTTTTTKNGTSHDSKIPPPEKHNASSSESSKITSKMQSTKAQKIKHRKVSKTHLETKIKHSKEPKIRISDNSNISQVLSLKEPIIQLTDIAVVANSNSSKIQESKEFKSQIDFLKPRSESPKIQHKKTSIEMTKDGRLKTSKNSNKNSATSKTSHSKKVKNKTKDQKDLNADKSKSKKNKKTSHNENKYSKMLEEELLTSPKDSIFENNKNNTFNTNNNDSDSSDYKHNTSKVDNYIEGKKSRIEITQSSLANEFNKETTQFDSDATYVSDLEDDDDTEISELTKNDEISELTTNDEIPDLTNNDKVDDRESLENLLEELEQLSAETGGHSSNVKEIYLEGQETTVDEILTEYLESDFEESDYGLNNNEMPESDEIGDKITQNENVTSTNNIGEVDLENNDSDLEKTSAEKLPTSITVTDASANSKSNVTREMGKDHDFATTEKSRQKELEFLQCHENLNEKSSEADDHNTCNNQNNDNLNDSVTLLVVAEEDGKSDRRKQKIELREDLTSPPKALTSPPPKAQIPLKLKKKRIMKSKKKDVLYENFDSATPLVFEIPKTGERSRKQKLQNRNCTENEELVIFKPLPVQKKVTKRKNGNIKDKSQEKQTKDSSKENAIDDDNVSIKEENESDGEINKNTQENDVNNTSELSSKYKVLVEEVLRTFNDPTEAGLELKEEIIDEEIDQLIVKENLNPIINQNKADGNKETQATVEENSLSQNVLKDNDLEIKKSDNYKDLVSEVLKSIDEIVGKNSEVNSDELTEVTEQVMNENNSSSLDDNKNQNKTPQKNNDKPESLGENIPQNRNETSQNNIYNDNETSQKPLNTNIDTKETKEHSIKRSNRKRKKNRKYFNDSDEKIDTNSNVCEQNIADSNMEHNINGYTSQESEDMVDRIKSRLTRKTNKKYFNDFNNDNDEKLDPNSNNSEQNIGDSNMAHNINGDTSQESEDMIDRIKSRRSRKTNKKYFSDSNDVKNNIEEKHSTKKKYKNNTEEKCSDKKKYNIKDKNSVKNQDNSQENKSSSNDNKSSNKIEESNKKIEKVIFSTHQCYVCFKVFATKDKLIEHCKSHFGIDRQRSLKKCPLCDFSCTAGFSRHMKKVHNVSIKIPYARIQEELVGENITYYFEVNDPIIKRVEVIPSVKNLNRRAMVKIDQEKREKEAKVIAKHKLVKKGNEWVVEKEEIKIDNVALPKLDSNVNISDKISDKNDYFDKLKKLYHVSKKNGKKMLFPCQSCDKVCQSLAALKLHNRKHEKNPIPFAPKVWKHKLENPNYCPPKIDKTIAIENKKKYFKRLEKVTKNNVDVVLQSNNKHAKPRPIKNNHKCSPELQAFYRNNIRGGDIEFWQFLKIFNKMDRDNINDFKDLEGNNEYGIIESGALH